MGEISASSVFVKLGIGASIAAGYGSRDGHDGAFDRDAQPFSASIDSSAQSAVFILKPPQFLHVFRLALIAAGALLRQLPDRLGALFADGGIGAQALQIPGAKEAKGECQDGGSHAENSSIAFA